MKRIAALLLALAALVGCDSDPTEEVESDAIYPDVTVAAASPSSATVTAILRIGGPVSQGYVNLGGDDSITAATGAQTLELDEYEGVLGDTWYSADFGDGAENAAYTFSLELERGDSFPDSTVSLPRPFDLTAPAASATVSRSSPMSVTWTDAGTSDTVWIDVFYSTCLAFEGNIYYPPGGDNGSTSIPTSALSPVQGEENATCSATLRVVRSRPGSIDDAFDSGSIQGWQVRTVEITSTP